MEFYIFEDSSDLENLPFFSEHLMNFFLVFVSLMTYLYYVFLLDASILTVTAIMRKREKINSSSIFAGFLLKFEEKTQLTLNDLNTQKTKLHTNPC